MKNEKLLADTFNNYFADIAKTLTLKKHQNIYDQSLSSITDYFKNNESAIKIKEKYDTQKNSFLFTLFSKEDIFKAIKSLSSNKTFLDVTPMFRKGNYNESTLSTFSKVFEKLLFEKINELLFEKINEHMQSKFSKHLTGFHSTQNDLLVMIVK